MVRARGIAGRRADALVSFFDEVLVGESFVGCVTPQFMSDLLVEVFCCCLSEAVGNGFDQNRIVIIAGQFLIFRQCFERSPCRHDKSADVVHALTSRRYPITQTEIRPLIGFVCQLPEVV